MKILDNSETKAILDKAKYLNPSGRQKGGKNPVLNAVDTLEVGESLVFSKTEWPIKSDPMGIINSIHAARARSNYARELNLPHKRFSTRHLPRELSGDGYDWIVMRVA